MKDFDVTSWNALFAPAGTPKEAIDKLHAGLVEVLAEPDIKAKLIDLGIEARATLAGGIETAPRGGYQEMGRRDRQGGAFPSGDVPALRPRGRV